MSKMESKTVPPSLSVSREGSVAVVAFDRPERLNAFGSEELRTLRRTLGELSQDTRVRAVVLTGRGKAFSAGGDVASMQEWLRKGDLPTAFHDLVGEQERCIREIMEMAKPVLAAIPGVAAGGGLSMALACDWRIAAPEATLVTAFLQLGGIPDGGLTYLLPHYLGIGGAQELLFGPGKVKAERARELGLVHEIVPTERLMARALERATELAKLPLSSFGWTKRLLVTSYGGTLETQLALERRGMVEAARGKELPEGIAAFLEKRPPRFEAIG
ncbi:MAG: enoyl-CoA hydratase/isomerase family protein [Euryarchaeota archaeon]|nr:enoyl-CoA hydratase/isomerase family protein [Euryarchaeota archaeon]